MIQQTLSRTVRMYLARKDVSWKRRRKQAIVTAIGRAGTRSPEGRLWKGVLVRAVEDLGRLEGHDPDYFFSDDFEDQANAAGINPEWVREAMFTSGLFPEGVRP